MIGTFEYLRPTDVDEALEMRLHAGEAAAWFAGGTELLLAMKMGLLRPTTLIDIKHVPELARLEVAEDGAIFIGASVTYAQILDERAIDSAAPVLQEVVKHIGNARVRTAGTIAGNLCFADPRSDAATLLSAWDASIHLASPDGNRREAKVVDFIAGPYMASLGEGELVLGVTIPPRLPTGYRKVQFFERPTLAVAVTGAVQDGMFAEPIRVVVGAGTARPTVLDQLGMQLAGLPADPNEIRLIEVANAAPDGVETTDDLAGSAYYKSRLLPRLIRDAIGAIETSTKIHV